jgi:hypothetical protein
MEFDEVLNKLFSYYKVSSITELASAIGAERSTVNGWKSRKALGTMLEYINSHDSKALNYIYTPISGQEINTVSGGQVAQHVHGNQSYNSDNKFEIDEEIKKVLKSALPIIDNDHKKEEFIKHIKEWIIENL